MLLQSFSSKRLNGHLDLQLRFHPDLSFLIGINGSGKTSVLRAIMACLGPDIDWLVSARFEEISVELTLPQLGMIKVLAARKDQLTELQYWEKGELKSEWAISNTDYSQMLRSADDFVYSEDGDRVRVRDTRVSLPVDMAVLRDISNIPNPIFLGLDRTSLPAQRMHSQRTIPRIRRVVPARRTHATVRAFLDESVAQAETLVTEALGRAYRERARRAAQLREEILLTLFSGNRAAQPVTMPKQKDLKRYEETRRSLKSAFSVLGISKSKIEQSIDPFFSNLIETASALTKYDSLEKAVQTRE